MMFFDRSKTKETKKPAVERFFMCKTLALLLQLFHVLVVWQNECEFNIQLLTDKNGDDRQKCELGCRWQMVRDGDEQ